MVARPECRCLFLLALLGLTASETGNSSGNAECKKLSFGEFHGDYTMYAKNSKSKRWLKPFVVPEHKLIFCTIAKNGSSGWLRLLRRMSGFEDWQRNPFFWKDGKIGGMRQLAHYGAQRAVEMLKDPSWKKVVVLREPLERLLSAFLDKIHGVHDSPTQLDIYSHELFDVPVAAFRELGFAEFVKRLHVAVYAGELDQHWSLQSLECGLDFWAPFYDLGLYMEEGGCDKEHMLEEIFNLVRPTTPNLQELEEVSDSFEAGVGETIQRHGTNHSGHWYTREVLEEAYQIYETDYRFLSAEKPTLATLNLSG